MPVLGSIVKFVTSLGDILTSDPNGQHQSPSQPARRTDLYSPNKRNHACLSSSSEHATASHTHPATRKRALMSDPAYAFDSPPSNAFKRQVPKHVQEVGYPTLTTRLLP